jgi:hypothetical protein
MKKISTLFLLLLSLSLPAQEPMSLESPEFEAYFLDGKNIPKLSGQLINADPETLAGLSLEFHFASPHYGGYRGTEVQPDGAGFFTVPVRHAFPFYRVWYEVKMERGRFFGSVLLNDSLFVRIDYQSIKNKPPVLPEGALVFSGPDSLLNAIDQEHFEVIGKEYSNGCSGFFHRMHLQNEVPSNQLVLLNVYFEERKKKEDVFFKKYNNQFRAFYENNRVSDYYEALQLLRLTYPVDSLPIQVSEYIAHEPIGMTKHAANYYYYLFGFLAKEDKYQSVGRDEISPTKQDWRLLKQIQPAALDKADQYHIILPNIQTRWARRFIETELEGLEK